MARRTSRTGRYWVAFWLGLFLSVAMVVVARQQAAIKVAGRLTKLRTKRSELDARRAGVVGQISSAASKEILGPKVAKIGLFPAPDSASSILNVGPDPTGRVR